MRLNVALLSLWKAFMQEFHEVENATTDAVQCRFAFVLEGIRAWFHEVENTTTDAAQLSLCFRCGRHSCMSSTKLKTLRPMRPNVALLSLWKAFLHEFHEVENATTDAAQCRFAFVVKGIHA
jgi:hypothetical protein